MVQLSSNSHGIYTTYMSMENTTPHQGSWGAIISILLILAIVVAGAYYAFTDRLSPSPTVDTSITY